MPHHLVAHEAWHVTASLMLTRHQSAGLIRSDTAKTHTHNYRKTIQHATQMPQLSSVTLMHVPSVRHPPLALDSLPACHAAVQVVPG